MDCLGNYTILSNIGDGSYASVKLARRLQDNKLYALKKVQY
jgi:serine/threonine protein kinase